MNLIPLPRKIIEKGGSISYTALRCDDNIADNRIKQALEKLPLAADGARLNIEIGNGEKEAYTLDITENSVLIKGESPRAVFYGIQTLRQIFANDNIPCLHIEDEPDFEHRGFYHDITRGKVPKVETIKRIIDDMAYYKLNSLQLYVEHTFEFEEYADSIERTGYITAQELREIDDYCKMNFIEFIPSLSTFGHLFELLQKDRYKHLQEAENFEGNGFYWDDRMRHHTIDPTNAESFEIIKSLLDQYMVNFSSDKFNICCDETFDLKTGKHKDEDTGKLYIDFVTKIVEYLKSKGKKVMMWADILLNHPEQIENLPDDVELLNWWYSPDPDENTFRIIQENKIAQIVCPGTGTWSRLCEDYETEIKNITNMVKFGHKYGAKGVLNTNWGDWGNPCSIELAMFGLVFGAAKSWNVSTDANNEYISAVNSLLYGNNNACEYVRRLSQVCYTVSWEALAKVYANICHGKTYTVEFPTQEALLKAVNECFDIIKDVSGDLWENERYKTQMLIASEGLAVMAELLAKQAGYAIIRKTDTRSWLEKYRNSWLEDNKKSEIGEIEKMFFAADNSL